MAGPRSGDRIRRVAAAPNVEITSAVPLASSGRSKAPNSALRGTLAARRAIATAVSSRSRPPRAGGLTRPLAPGR